ncbi:deoxyribodipyrimidine photo-lyase, partial [bacterium]|nr:deoxyribodipyrimidine photo-lyase [bacterium]
KKFDPDCLYIKQWIPELDPLPPSEIHHLHTVHSLPLGIYPAPMCDHKKESLLSKNYFKQCG